MMWQHLYFGRGSRANVNMVPVIAITCNLSLFEPRICNRRSLNMCNLLFFEVVLIKY